MVLLYLNIPLRGNVLKLKLLFCQVFLVEKFGGFFGFFCLFICLFVVSRSPIVYDCIVKSYQRLVPEFYFTNLLMVFVQE